MLPKSTQKELQRVRRLPGIVGRMNLTKSDCLPFSCFSFLFLRNDDSNSIDLELFRKLVSVWKVIDSYRGVCVIITLANGTCGKTYSV